MRRVFSLLILPIFLITCTSCSLNAFSDSKSLSSTSSQLEPGTDSLIDDDSNVSSIDSDETESAMPTPQLTVTPTLAPTQTPTLAPTPTAVPTKIIQKALIFDDALLEVLIRQIVKKPTGDVMPSDFDMIGNPDLLFTYQAFNDYSTICGGTTFGNIGEFYYSVEGKVASLKALTTLPIKDITISYGVTAENPHETYEYDLKYLTSAGVLERLFISGGIASDDAAPFHTAILKNFSSLSNCPDLRVLQFYNCVGANLDSSLNLYNLEHLSLRYCDTISIQALRNAANLQTISIVDTQIADLSPLKDKPSITTVSLSDLDFVDTATLLTLPNLARLDIYGCAEYSSDDVAKLKEKGVNVKIG